MYQYFAYPWKLGQDNSSRQKLSVQLIKRLKTSVRLPRHHREPTTPALKIIHQHLMQFPMVFPIHYANSSKHSISTPTRMLTARRSVHHQR